MSDDTRFGIPPDLQIGPSAAALPLAGEVNWGMATMRVRQLRDAVPPGTGFPVGVIDTGIDASHAELSGNVGGAKDFTGSPYGSADRNGHGTHCSGTVAASDPRIGVGCEGRLKVWHGKALSDQGSGAGSWIAAAMRWCLGNGCGVVSMSLGSSGPDSQIDAAGRELAAAGVWVIAAAGNSGGGTPDVDFPARFPWAMSVAALDSQFRPASFTNRGAKIDTAGAGVAIWSARPGGGYQQMSGTSMATPFAAGVLGLFRAAMVAKKLPVPSAAELRAILANRSTDTHTPGDDDRTGPGWVSAPLLLPLLTPDPKRAA